jgi:hypothetical protein
VWGACIAPDGTWPDAFPVSAAGQAEVFGAVIAVTPSGRGVFVYRADGDLWAATLD